MSVKIDLVYDMMPVILFLDGREREQFYADWKTDFTLIVRNLGDRFRIPGWSVPEYAVLLAYDLEQAVKRAVTSCIGVRIINAKPTADYRLHVRLEVVQGQQTVLPKHKPSTTARVNYEMVDT